MKKKWRSRMSELEDFLEQMYELHDGLHIYWTKTQWDTWYGRDEKKEMIQ